MQLQKSGGCMEALSLSLVIHRSSSKIICFFLSLFAITLVAESNLCEHSSEIILLLSSVQAIAYDKKFVLVNITNSYT